ncbi:hypothetical protein PAXRUDRAFT_33442 [Paxillus rubicundulus Ve08.2h10]|uniref:Uncharacterized protein n=1 Tax=Paxillus rubicundulus Ve08.2h10 TaxID=930991 RepID=A0A0D0DQF1_9AGAM|nr:hypothetical protein PAXRUDRAFT_33442 [Paxillus rubicundulus Ve08.2h10]
MPSNPQDIYARLLIPPDDNLPKVCRDEGLRIGDVGIVTERGTFDILFNICLPEEHPLNQRGGVPATFKQVPLSVWDVSKIPQLGLSLDFTSTSAAGATLVLPEGAGTEDLLSLGALMKEAKEKGESWYHYAYFDRERTTINNDSLYLVTGYHKTSSWAVAAFSDASCSGGFNAAFTAGQVVEGNIAAAYSWQVTNSIHWRVGPEEGHNVNSRNQAVSIRGFKIALRDSVFGLLRQVKVSSEFPGTKSSTSRAYLRRSISPGYRARGHGELQRQPPGGESSRGRDMQGSQC